ncbi:sigma-70 family RNA polymerase sigma factor [Rathayibacter sp. VKM Ac-2803]|uniref:sigma-70 family RNA polymerase sigma factor n=1 Tax=unclassified Rathayibacter TaxID=2609250 RepID=UPI00135BFA85|nr:MULTISPECIES: sigma-70 family RNA polymerase sigma factor [unclassified Rathayibacter]MWV50686.1 sigma-70 family RNA polymerase sigma factor [Rathayibacter sp. VKM Ac-2803]MWV59686.1 sigma-70 family RNA polymerase sigma factor [Rathayibacter sp. VKM Ac-2754]
MSEDQAEMLRALHDEHSAALWRFVLRLTGDRHLAEDVVQEALLRAWKHPEILAQGEAAARSWLYTVARNLVIDDRRSARHAREFGTDEVPERAHGDRTDQVLDAWLLSEALSEVSHDHRAVIVHAYYGGRSVSEIAELLDIAPGTVKSRMHYGMRALKLALQERGVTEL